MNHKRENMNLHLSKTAFALVSLSAIFQAISMDKDKELGDAIAGFEKETVAKIVHSGQANVNARWMGMQMLMVVPHMYGTQDICKKFPEKEARKKMGYEIAQILLDAGADPNSKDNNLGLTVLHKAVIEKDVALAKLLLERGAHVNCATTSGRTPLMLAARHSTQLLELLLTHNADPFLKNDAQETALDIAQQSNIAVAILTKAMSKNNSHINCHAPS
jgi:hypothetical protein